MTQVVNDADLLLLLDQRRFSFFSLKILYHIISLCLSETIASLCSS